MSHHETPAVQIETMLRNLIASIVFREESIEINRDEFVGHVSWLTRVHAEDTGKIVGREGTHLKAFTLVVKESAKFLGDEKLQRFKVLDPLPAAFQERSSPKAKDYNPEPAKTRLEEVLVCVGVQEFKIGSTCLRPDMDGTLRFEFSIQVRTEDDYNLLTVAPQIGNDDATVIGAIGTIFRAGARRDGIKSAVTVTRI